MVNIYVFMMPIFICIFLNLVRAALPRLHYLAEHILLFAYGGSCLTLVQYISWHLVVKFTGIDLCSCFKQKK